MRDVDTYAVVGHPIAHSKSPLIHAMFAESLGERLVYERILAPLDGFARTVQTFFAEGGRGLNVTVPFKLEAHALCEVRTERAIQAGAVNTLWMDHGRLCGDNTDGVGLVRDLRDNLGVTLREARVLLIGAGGAARGVLQPVLDEAPAMLVVVNRTRARAEELVASASGPLAQRCKASDFATLDGAFDLVINATSASLGGDIPPVPAAAFAPNAFVYDLMYADKPTPFLAHARSLGVTTCADGLGMLVEQAAEAYERWRGRRPHTRPVIERLRDALRREAVSAA
ncbi:MAG TPA: shikimate dehydrogenase [Burkholderiaceae bacterium]|nr:shikimate dehydrogenase [Burkholderiaceae bacterium]